MLQITGCTEYDIYVHILVYMCFYLVILCTACTRQIHWCTARSTGRRRRRPPHSGTRRTGSWRRPRQRRASTGSPAGASGSPARSQPNTATGTRNLEEPCKTLRFLARGFLVAALAQHATHRDTKKKEKTEKRTPLMN